MARPAAPSNGERPRLPPRMAIRAILCIASAGLSSLSRIRPPGHRAAAAATCPRCHVSSIAAASTRAAHLKRSLRGDCYRTGTICRRQTQGPSLAPPGAAPRPSPVRGRGRGLFPGDGAFAVLAQEWVEGLAEQGLDGPILHDTTAHSCSAVASATTSTVHHALATAAAEESVPGPVTGAFEPPACTRRRKPAVMQRGRDTTR